ncbi:MAG: M23 family metallopeptidase [Calditrichia bacterium]
MSLLCGSYIFYIFLAGEWHVSGYGIRMMLPVVFAVAIGASFYRLRNLSAWHRRDAKEWFGGLIIFLFLAIFSGLAIWSYIGKTHNKAATQATFPLKTGDYAIIDGGNSPIINSLHRYPDVPDKFSMKIVKLSSVGKQASGFFSTDSSASHILGERVYSPVDGIVTEAVDGVGSLQLSWSDSLDENVAGNRVHIHSNTGVTIVLNHLQKGSLMVSEGDTVIAGQPLARVGDSGYVDQPLLHIYAYREGDFPPWEGRGLPIHFNGNFLIRNDVIRQK